MSYSFSGFGSYLFRNFSGFVTEQGTITEDASNANPTIGTVNDVLEVGEQVLYKGVTKEIYLGTTTINGVTMIVTQGLSGQDQYLYVPDGVDHNSITWPTKIADVVIVEENTIICFAAGTLIATSDGQTVVEALEIGDLIQTADGRRVPVKWIGRQTLHKWRHGPNMQPVRIRAGAFGDGLPHSDLTVTADHGMIIDEYVINASALVNHDTIDFVALNEMEEALTVYHIETENHDVILANGAPSETFIDVAGRAGFDNHQEYLDLYGIERIVPEMARTRISSRRLLPLAIKTRLALTDQTHIVISNLSA